MQGQNEVVDDEDYVDEDYDGENEHESDCTSLDNINFDEDWDWTNVLDPSLFDQTQHPPPPLSFIRKFLLTIGSLM